MKSLQKEFLVGQINIRCANVKARARDSQQIGRIGKGQSNDQHPNERTEVWDDALNELKGRSRETSRPT